MLDRFLALLVRLAFLTSITMLASGIGHAAAHPAPHQSGPAGEAVLALVGGEAMPIVIPTGFVEFAGYRPVVFGDTLANPAGSCSAPDWITPDAFVAACRTHDLGYDLLRFAEARGERLGVWARLELDRRFSTDLRVACSTWMCHRLASLFELVVTVNSIRQGYGAPAPEPALPWLLVGLGLVFVARPAPPGPASPRRSRTSLLPA